MSTAIFDATSPEAWPPMPSATMASLSASGRKKLSSLCWRLRPMLVSPAKRTRPPRMGKDELLRATEYHSSEAGRQSASAGGYGGRGGCGGRGQLADRGARQADEAQAGAGRQDQLASL